MKWIFAMALDVHYVSMLEVQYVTIHKAEPKIIKTYHSVFSFLERHIVSEPPFLLETMFFRVANQNECLNKQTQNLEKVEGEVHTVIPLYVLI
jgi:hypothetical protein